MCLRILSCLFSPQSCLSISLSSSFHFGLSSKPYLGFRVSFFGWPPLRDREINLTGKCFSSPVPGVRNSSASGAERKQPWGRAFVLSEAGIVQGRVPVYPAPFLSRILHLQSTHCSGRGSRSCLVGSKTSLDLSIGSSLLVILINF